MASGHVNRANRPNTWPLRPTPQSEDSPRQPGAVHTWPIASVLSRPSLVCFLRASGQIMSARFSSLGVAHRDLERIIRQWQLQRLRFCPFGTSQIANH